MTVVDTGASYISGPISSLRLLMETLGARELSTDEVSRWRGGAGWEVLLVQTPTSPRQHWVPQEVDHSRPSPPHLSYCSHVAGSPPERGTGHKHGAGAAGRPPLSKGLPDSLPSMS